MIENEKVLATALYLAIYEAHPSYANTGTWSGRVSGQMMTSHCSLTQGIPPGEDWVERLDQVLRDWLVINPDFDIAAAATALKKELTD